MTKTAHDCNLYIAQNCSLCWKPHIFVRIGYFCMAQIHTDGMLMPPCLMNKQKKNTTIRNSNRFLHLVRASVSKISPLKLIRFKFVEISYFYSFWIWFGSHDLSFSGIQIRFLFFRVFYCLGTVNPKFPIVSIVIRQISCKITSELAFSVLGAKFDEFLRWFEYIHMKFNPLRHSVKNWPRNDTEILNLAIYSTCQVDKTWIWRNKFMNQSFFRSCPCYFDSR